MSDGRLTTYGELAEVVENLPLIVREIRRARGLSIRAAARQIGCPASVVLRCESGEGIQTKTFVSIMRWLDQANREATP